MALLVYERENCVGVANRILLFSREANETEDVCSQARCSITQGRSQDFSKGGGGSHCVKHYRHGVFATEYCRLFA